jgi:hypothetical protein
VSHIPLRKESDCLNCGATIHGRYCHVCGQENTVRHESFWHMARHFFYDITHFDTKFFGTLKLLLFKPGFLSKEYVNGRRASYLHPVKMYVFTSAVFFLIFFSFISSGTLKVSTEAPLTKDQRLDMISELKEEAKTDTSASIKAQLALLKDTTRIVTVNDLIKIADKSGFMFINVTGAASKFKTVAQYDSAQNLLPGEKKDGWLRKTLKRREIELSQRYGQDPTGGVRKFYDGFLHKLPYLLFISLPLFALFLKLLYIRRKEFFYFDHVVFSIHHYIFSFILLLFVFGFQKLFDWLHAGVFNIIAALLFLSGGFYLYKAMRKFYGQRRAKTIIKFILLNIMGFIGMLILFAVFVLFSIFQL